MSKLQLLTVEECDAIHAERQRQKDETKQIEIEAQQTQDRWYQLRLPQLIDEYIEYLASCQRERQLPISVNPPPDGGEDLINERLKPYHLYLASRCTEHGCDPVRYHLTRLANYNQI